MTLQVAIREFMTPEGTLTGVGTEVEFKHWQAEGVFGHDWKLGAVLGYEPAILDEARRRAWAGEARLPFDESGEAIAPELLA